jgi:hypothetical protein
MDVVQSQIMIRTAVGTAVVPLFFDCGPPHSFGIRGVHGQKVETIVSRRFEHETRCSVGLLLLLFGESCFHISIRLWRDGALTFGTTGACCLASIHVGVQSRWLGVSFVHFFVLLPLAPFLARLDLGDSKTIVPFFVWLRSGPPLLAMPRRRRSVHRSSEAFFTAGSLFSFRW